MLAIVAVFRPKVFFPPTIHVLVIESPAAVPPEHLVLDALEATLLRLKANVAYALKRPGLGPLLRDWLREVSR